jgi:hypothetical protein
MAAKNIREKPYPDIELSCAVSDAVLTAASAYATSIAIKVNPFIAVALGSICAAAGAGTVRFGLLPSLLPVHTGLTALSRLVCLPLLSVGFFLGRQSVPLISVLLIVAAMSVVFKIVPIVIRRFPTALFRTVLPAIGLGGTALLSALHQPMLHSALVSTLATISLGLWLEGRYKAFGIKSVDIMHYTLALACIGISSDALRL